MKKLVKVLLVSLPILLNVVLLMFFILFLFAILGLHSFNGNSYYQCRLTPEPVNETYWPTLTGYNRLCNSPNDTGSCPAGTFCGHPMQYNISLENEYIRDNPYIQYGVINFDNIGRAILSVFEVLTLSGWSYIMYIVNSFSCNLLIVPRQHKLRV